MAGQDKAHSSVKDEREADKIAEPTSMFVYQQPQTRQPLALILEA
jgi:hypothetical protein